jgi:hypothetical protein
MSYIWHVLFYLWLFMLGFILYAGCQNAIAKRKWLVLVIPAPVLIVFGLADVLFNQLFGRLIFWEWRYTLTFSQRLDCHVFDEGWRGSIARELGWLLDVFLPGHIEGGA